MIFNGKYYDNVQFTSIGENKEREWSHVCLRIDMNVMFAKVPNKKGIKLFNERAFESILKEYTQLEYINVVVSENQCAHTRKKSKFT